MSRPQESVAALQDGIRRAIDVLNASLVDDSPEYPKMMFHPDLEPRTVNNLGEEQELVKQGWSQVHDPAFSADQPQSKPKPVNAEVGYPKTFYRAGLDPKTANNLHEEQDLVAQGWSSVPDPKTT